MMEFITYTKRDIFFTVLLAILYFLAGELSFWFFSDKFIITFGTFIPEGIALAFVLYFGAKVIPGIFFGQFLLAYLSMNSYIAAVDISIVNSLEAFLALYLFERFNLDIRLQSFKDLFGLYALIFFVLQPFSAILSNLALYLHGFVEFSTIFQDIFSWWMGNLMGQFLYTPFLLLLLTNYKEIDFKKYFTYALLYGMLVFFLIIVLNILNPFLIISITMPILIYVVSKDGIVYGSMMSVVVSLVSALSFWYGIGAFQGHSNLDNTINYNFFSLSHMLISLTVGLLFYQRQKYEKILKESIAIEVQKNEEQRLLMLQQSRLAQMGEMISMIAHQWRQPLNNLSLLNQLLVTKYTKHKLDDDAMEYFKKNSKKQIDLMSTTIDDFRNFFKTEKEKKMFCIDDVLENILDMTKPIYTSSSITIDYYMDDKYQMFGYPNALAQAILNIINNAKDAFVERGIESRKIDIRVREEDDNILIEIVDNAGGINHKIIDKIFDPYFSTKSEKNGTGLGLYMSKMLIEEQLEAKMYVDNEKDGAKFTICFKGGLCEK